MKETIGFFIFLSLFIYMTIKIVAHREEYSFKEFLLTFAEWEIIALLFIVSVKLMAN